MSENTIEILDGGRPATVSFSVAPANTNPHSRAHPLADQRPAGQCGALYANAVGLRLTIDR